MAGKTDKTLWGIHGGKTGDADNLFLKHGVIALGWTEMGNMSKLAADREAFKAKLLEIRPDRKERYYWISAGQCFRFVHEAKKGDLVIYPSRHDRHIHIGEITGPYQYDTKPESGYPQHRPVKWLKSFPRTQFSQGALYEIGSAMSFFQVKNYADEFLAALSGREVPTAGTQDESISYVAEDIEQNTSDFILKTLAQELKGHALAEFIAHLLGTMGYQTRLSPEGPDGGVDIIAHKDELGFEPPIIKVQVKSTEGSIGDPIVSQLYGKVERSEYGMVVTLGTFTNQAETFARNKSNLRLIDGEDLVGLILQHYERFDSKYKGLLPLKRVYVPEPLEETE
ncbi:MAG: restriction endonuclease [Candidatus Aureabacteria bacterium]|nr:restriction endonuclease [Candidatus Auribacterota bacterium]